MEKNKYKNFSDKIFEQKEEIKRIKKEIKDKIDQVAHEIDGMKNKKLIIQK